VVPPTTAKRHFYPAAARRGFAIILDFSNVQEYPELFSAEHRLDADHVNAVGARIFTRLLANHFTEAMRIRGERSFRVPAK
jgi:hypothetical protein